MVKGSHRMLGCEPFLASAGTVRGMQTAGCGLHF